MSFCYDMCMFISIVTITRDNLAGLKKTCESLRKQSSSDFEWIVIDGDSQDGSCAYLKDKNVILVSEPDQGIYDAMNKGIDRAKGDYVLFLNAGDMLADNRTLKMLAEKIDALSENPDFIYGDSWEDRPEHDPAYKTARSHKNLWGMFTHHQSMLYRREVIGDLRYDLTFKVAADYKFTLQFLKKAKIKHYCRFPICWFEAGGLSQTEVETGRLEQFRIRPQMLDISPILNWGIYGLQSIAMFIRRLCPDLYWSLKH